MFLEMIFGGGAWIFKIQNSRLGQAHQISVEDKNNNTCLKIRTPDSI